MDMLGKSMLDTLGFLSEIGEAIEEKNNQSGIVIYTKNNCAQCKMTKLHLANLGINDYTERNVAEHEEFLVEAQATGFTSMPIVVVDGRVIASGFQPDKLNELEGSN